MALLAYTISEWEEAVKDRHNIEFKEIYLQDGYVKVVIGTIKVPYSTKGTMRIKKVRWNHFGICLEENGLENGLLTPYNIHLPNNKK